MAHGKARKLSGKQTVGTKIDDFKPRPHNEILAFFMEKTSLNRAILSELVYFHHNPGKARTAIF